LCAAHAALCAAHAALCATATHGTYTKGQNGSRHARSNSAMPVDLPADATITYAQQYRRCGKPGCPVCASGGRGHGPYWYAYWRQEGRARSRYVGKQPPATAASPQPPPSEQSVAAGAAPVAHGLRVRTLGAFAIWRGQQRIAVERWERQQSGVLFKMLLGAPGYRLTRDEIVERFWPEGTPKQSLANLRLVLYRLRRALADGDGAPRSIQYDGEVVAVALSPENAVDWLDAEAFARAARGALAGRDLAANRRALAMYTGDYLPADAYEEWALGRREELGRLRIAVLMHGAALCAASGETEEAENSLRAVLAADPCHEPAVLALMRLYAGAGRDGQALRTYRRFVEALHEDLALEPEAETRALAHTLSVRQAAAPTIEAPNSPPNNLPEPLTSFVGRRRELEELRVLLQPPRTAFAVADGAGMAAPCRLLTLTGPGGVGKTRLALQLADWLLDEPGTYPDGVWLVELAALTGTTADGDALVAKSVAQALALREEETRPLADILVAHLKRKQLLLLLDNCEHLVDACAGLTTALLTACPGMRILATSRAVLGVPGEQPWALPPLSLPDHTASGQAGRLGEFEAVRLFLERARVHRRDLVLTDENAEAVMRICRYVDGIPLALELAAARVSLLSVEQIAARLGEGSRLLTGGPRTAPRRQQTLRATLDWSYHLLREPERALLRRLSVFAGGCSLEAVEAVCASEDLAVEEVLDLLDSLVLQSLVQRDSAGGAPRYGQLEMVREYGRGQLAAAGEAGWVSLRHLSWYRAAVEHTLTNSRRADYQSRLLRLEADHHNLRAALNWALVEKGDPAAGVQLAGALADYWHRQGHLREGRRWLDVALQYLESETVQVRDIDRARVFQASAAVAHYQGQSTRAIALQSDALLLQRQLGDPVRVVRAMHDLGIMLLVHGEYGRAQILLEESLSFERDHNDRRGLAISLLSLGMLSFAQGDLQRAQAMHEEGLAIAEEFGDTQVLALELSHLAVVALARGNNADAVTRFGRSAALHWEHHDTQSLADALDGLAVASAQADPERSALLFGATQALRQTLGAPLLPLYHTLHANAVAAARNALGEASFAAQWERGRALPLESAVQLALHAGNESHMEVGGSEQGS
jgi:predicted ATPase/DNA-binding SARP family transcriptional activator